jgi:hypothetical protein
VVDGIVKMTFLKFILFYFILKVIDCRICGDPHSVLRFAFVEFSDERKLIVLACKPFPLVFFSPLPRHTDIMLTWDFC